MTIFTVPPVAGGTNGIHTRPRSTTVAGYLALTAGHLALFAGVGVVATDLAAFVHLPAGRMLPHSLVVSGLRGVLVALAAGLGMACAILLLWGNRVARVPLTLLAAVGVVGAMERAHHYWAVYGRSWSMTSEALAFVALELFLCVVLAWAPATGRWLRTRCLDPGRPSLTPPGADVSRHPRLSRENALTVVIVGGTMCVGAWGVFVSSVASAATNESSVGGPIALAIASLAPIATLPAVVMVVAGAEAMHRASRRGDQDRG